MQFDKTEFKRHRLIELTTATSTATTLQEDFVITLINQKTMINICNNYRRGPSFNLLNIIISSFGNKRPTQEIL